MTPFPDHLPDFETQDSPDSVLRFFDGCFQASQPQDSEFARLSTLFDPSSSPPSGTPDMSHFDSVFSFPIFHPNALPLCPPPLDYSPTSRASTPSSSNSLTYSPHSLDEVQAPKSFNTDITTPSPNSSHSPPSISRSIGKGKQREDVPTLPSLEFDKGDRVPIRVTGWHTDISIDEPGPSFSPSSTSISDSPPAHFVTTSGLSRAFSQQRFEPPRTMQIVTTESSLSTPTSTSGSPAPSRPSSRPSSARAVSMNIKLKLKRSREFLTGKRKHDGESSPLTPAKSTEFLVHTLSTRPKGISILESGIRPVRAYTSPLPASPYSDLGSPPTSPVLTVQKHDFAQGNAADDDKDMDAEPTPPDSFDNRLPIEIRLHIFRLLVIGFVGDLHMQVVKGQWSVAKAAETKWVGWEGGIRELVKISRVSRTWQALALDGQLWSTLGGSSAIPSALLSRISAIAGPFVRSLQLEGMSSLSSEDLVVITSKISLADHHAPGIDFPASVPVERWITNLTDINLSGTTVSTRALHKLLASCPLLERLCLRGMNAVTNSTCIIIGDANPRLITLDLRRCPNMDSFGLILICEAVDRRRAAQEGGFNNPSQMRELRLSGLKRVSETAMTYLAQSFPALEVLDLSYIPSLTDECLERFVEWLETDDLTSSLSPSSSSSPPDVVRLSSREVGLDPTDRTMYERRVTRLRHLNLSYCPDLTHRSCSYLAHTVPQLEFLELAGIGAGLEDAGLVRLLKTTPFIRKIDLEDATHITDDVLAAITPSLTTRPTASIAITAPSRLASSTSQSHFRRRTLGSLPLPPQPGEKLEHLVLSYASLVSAPAFSALVHSCPRLRTLEVDNTNVTDEVVRDFVELCRERGTRNATITAVDCVSVARGIVDELAAQGSTRTRNGWRSWEASVAGLNYADAVDGDEDFAGGLDECDDRRVTVKSFRSWQMVDRWVQEKERRKEGTSGTTGAGRYSNGGSRRWFGRRSTVSGGVSASVSGANTPGDEDDERGCIIM